MLIEFSVENFLSFRERATLSMVATTRKELLEEATFMANSLMLLKSAVIYGPNAGGKSNLFKAMSFMKRFVLTSTNLRNEIDVTPFLFSTATENKPSTFEIVFIQEGTQYRYGFTVDRKKVHSEWLFYIPNKIETMLFIRDGKKPGHTSKFKEAFEIWEKVRPDSLLLTVAAEFNSTVATQVLKWFRKFNVISGFKDYYPYTFPFIEKHTECYDKVLQIIKAADIGIENLNIRSREIPWENVPEEIKLQAELSGKKIEKFKEIEVDAVHQKHDVNGNPVGMCKINFPKYESDGTHRILSLIGPILDTLNSGKILFIDEFEVGLHPLLSQLMVQLFNTKRHNPNNAQLLLTTHNPYLININLFRRDQFWFVEKDRLCGSKLYSLSEFRKRKDTDLQKHYIEGRFGAIPIIQEELINELECEN